LLASRPRVRGRPPPKAAGRRGGPARARDSAPVSVQLRAESSNTHIDTHLTLTGYDASNHPVATDQQNNPSGNLYTLPLQIHSATSNIKYFTIATDDPNIYGLGFSNIAWGCA
jgi:hypothetical protein